MQAKKTVQPWHMHNLCNFFSIQLWTEISLIFGPTDHFLFIENPGSTIFSILSLFMDLELIVNFPSYGTKAIANNNKIIPEEKQTTSKFIHTKQYTKQKLIMALLLKATCLDWSLREC